jgi:hypothetical protein
VIPYISRLLKQALLEMPPIVSSNWVAVLVAITVFFLTLWFMYLHGRSSKKNQWKEDIFIGLAVVVVASCFLYAYGIVLTIYNDHQQLVHANSSQQNEISELKNRLAEASKNTATQPVAVTQPVTTKESSNSLRRRILRIANETEAFETQRNRDRAGIDMTRDAQGKIPALIKFDDDTAGMYISSGLKEKTISIIQELKARGIDVRNLEFYAQQGALNSAGPSGSGYGELQRFRELAYRLDASGIVIKTAYHSGRP